MSNDQTCLTNNAAVGTPCPPPNVFIEMNIKYSINRVGKILSPSDLLWFYNQVRNKGPWDFKQKGPGYADFIRLAVIARDGYADKALQQRLLDYYVSVNLVPQSQFMQHPDILQVYQDVQSVFR